MVHDYVRRRCFGGILELDDAAVRRALGHSGLLDAAAGLFAREIGRLTVEATPVRLQGERYRLSDTRRFTWRRMDFLDNCDDVEGRTRSVQSLLDWKNPQRTPHGI